MDLQSQLKKHFPDLKDEEEKKDSNKKVKGLWISDTPIACKYEKRNGKVNTILADYDGDKEDYKELAKLIKKKIGVGGGVKSNQIVIQGDYRKEIMEILAEMGFKTKRVGG